MRLPKEVACHLESQLPGAKLSFQSLPEIPEAEFLLIDPAFDDSQISTQQADQLGDDPPYWILCWASGRALVEAIFSGRVDVSDKVVVDFGAGAGVVAIAAAMNGAKQVYACEIDPVARCVITLNCERNGIDSLKLVSHLDQIHEPVDLVVAADVLYEARNLVFLDWFLGCCHDVIVADSRLKTFSHAGYVWQDTVSTTSFPDFREAKANNEVRFFVSSSLAARQKGLADTK